MVLRMDEWTRGLETVGTKCGVAYTVILLMDLLIACLNAQMMSVKISVSTFISFISQ